VAREGAISKAAAFDAAASAPPPTVPCSLFNAASIPNRDEEDEEDESDDDEPGEHEASARFLLLPAPATNADGTSAARGEATSILQLMSLLNSHSPEQDKEINLETERRYESQEQALEDHSTTCEEQVVLLRVIASALFVAWQCHHGGPRPLPSSLLAFPRR
jgi:hypothetical protein